MGIPLHQKKDHLSLAEAAREYAGYGWALVALDGKNPIGHGWQKSVPLDPDDASDIWSRRSNNMGIVLGPSGVVDYELDSGDESLYLRLAGMRQGDYPPTPMYRTGSGKPHLLFRDPGGLSRRTRDGIELRAGPHQSVIPPSVHPDTGKPYEWIMPPSEKELADIPQAILDFFAEPGRRGSGDGHWREPLRGQRKLGLGEGRHASLISFLGKAVNLFDNADQLIAAGLVYADETQDPPYPEETIREQALDIWHRYRDVPETPQEAKEFLHIKTGDQIRMRSVRFLWKPFLQRAAFHLLVGRKGAGKGSTLAWAAAQMTRGQLGDDPPRPVLWIATEDSFDIDVIPRFKAQSGEPRMIHCVQQSILLPQDMPAIRAVCQEENVGMVIIDPMAGVIGGVDSNAEGPVVAAIGGLNQLADELDLCIIGVRHLSKDNREPLQRVLGSAAWVNTPRAVLSIEQAEDGFARKVLMELIAGNRTRSGATTEFYLGDRLVDGLDTPVSYVEPV